MKVLILTDHTNHSIENSLYDLAVKTYLHPLVSAVDIASKATKDNAGFFNCVTHSKLYATPIDESFQFNVEYHPLAFQIGEVDTKKYDFVWLRLPPPLAGDFLKFVDQRFKSQVVINNPIGIYETGSKDFLMHFQSICPPMRICKSIDDIIAFKSRFPIVLKPLRDYGGRGILKIDGDLVLKGAERFSFHRFKNSLKPQDLPLLAVKFLENVRLGDKRIIVIKNEIMGASLRLPPSNSWICNVSLGGTSNMTEVTEDEIRIVHTISPKLTQMGIVFFGIDTLVNDDGARVLSEINTTSIGGLPQIAKLKGEPIVEQGIDLIVEYVNNHKKRYHASGHKY